MCPRSMKDRVMNRIGELDSVNLQNFIQMISKEHRFLSSLFDSLQEAILVISSAHTILYHNAAAKEFLGLPDKLASIPVEKLLPGLNLDLLLADSKLGSRKSMRQELELTYPEHRIVQMYALPIDRADAPYALILNDITATMERAASEVESERGKAVSMLVLGSLLLIFCHLTFAFILPLFKGSAVGGIIIAYVTILVLGASFSLVPASLWPSVPKLVDAKVIGSAYALIFWIQNIGLWLFPLLIGKVLDATNPEGTSATELDYTAPLVMLACLGVAALILGFILKAVDKKKGIGLELPNIKE